MKIIKQLTLAATVMLLASCKTPQGITYFQDIQDGKTFALQPQQDIRLQTDDRISIIVKCKSADISNLFNLSVPNQVVGQSEATSLSQSRGVVSYTVDQNGDIIFPMIGKMHVGGLSRLEVERKVKSEIESRELAKDVVVAVEFLNIRFQVLGEVKSPSRYSVSTDCLTLPEAISMAGDLTLYGLRDHVYVIRKEGNHTVTHEVNLLNYEQTLSSPAYYIQQDDIVYVEANNTRKRQSTASGNQFSSASTWISVASILTTLAVLIFK